MPHVLLVGSKNAHKIGEIRDLLAPLRVEVRSAAAFPDLPDVEETGDTYLANAELKAEAFAAATGLPTIADDSGLEVDALDGAPGVYSARYGGEPTDYRRNNDKLLAALEGVSDDRRTARFHCVIACAVPDGRGRASVAFSVEGTAEGRILTEWRGDGGFGYDPLFFYPPEGCTFAELSPGVKNRVSHRARALQAFRDRLETEWGSVFGS